MKIMSKSFQLSNKIKIATKTYDGRSKKVKICLNLTENAKMQKYCTLQLDMWSKTQQVVAKIECLKVIHTYFSSFSLVGDVLQNSTASGHEFQLHYTLE